MDRGASAAFLTELLKSSNVPCYLVEVVFDDQTVRMTDAWKDVVWSGNTYTANGHFLGFSGLTESADMQIPTVSVTVSAVDQAWVSIVLTKDYMDRPLRIYKGFIDYAAGVINAPLLIFDGRLDGFAIQDDPDAGKSVVQASAVSLWADFQRRAGRHSNDAEQQAVFAGDRFFDRNTDYNRQLKWGRA